jgi:hypothetical protein
MRSYNTLNTLALVGALLLSATQVEAMMGEDEARSASSISVAFHEWLSPEDKNLIHTTINLSNTVSPLPPATTAIDEEGRQVSLHASPVSYEIIREHFFDRALRLLSTAEEHTKKSITTAHEIINEKPPVDDGRRVPEKPEAIALRVESAKVRLKFYEDCLAQYSVMRKEVNASHEVVRSKLQGTPPTE